MKHLSLLLTSLVAFAPLTSGCDESAPADKSKPKDADAKDKGSADKGSADKGAADKGAADKGAAAEAPEVSLPGRLAATLAKVDAKVEGVGDVKPVAFTVELPKEWASDDTGSPTRLKWVNGGADRDYLGRVDISWRAKKLADMGADMLVKRPGEEQSVTREEVVDGIKLTTHVGKANSNVIRMRARTVLDVGDEAALICEAGIVRDEGLGDAKAAQDLVEGICLKIALKKG